MRSRIKNYFTLTKKEWNGMVILVVLIALVVAAPYVYRFLRKDSKPDFKDFDKIAAQINSIEEKSDVKTDGTDTIKNPHPVMFAFNPNSLSASQWQALGLSLHQANVILHYEVKGGHFYQKTDLKKIYAVTAADYTRLEPYIAIPDSAGFIKTQKAKPGEVIELNTADSARLTELNGIGPSFAIRIVRYRGLLGGFIRKEQLMEVYDIDSAKYDGLKKQVSVDISKVKKIEINTISFNQLRLFPYLNYKQVNAIIQYRQQHGNYVSVADLRNVVLLDEATITKIEPYLNFR